jgi:flagellar protein FliS
MDARFSYRETAVRGASPARLVVLLYEQAIEDLRRARAALDGGDIEARTRHINHAILVMGHLQSSLDMERGGTVAQYLVRFYDVVRAALVEAQVRQSAAVLEQQISLLMQMHKSWCEVERANAGPAPVAGSEQPQSAQGRISSPDWNA